MTEYSLIANKIAEIGRRLYDKGMIAGMDGNISARFDGNIIITPSGRCKGYLSADDLVVIDEHGRVISGAGKPSSETAMHVTIYRSRPDVQACVHAHPPYATAFAVAGAVLESDILPEVVLVVGEIPLVEYAPTGTDLLGKAIAGHIANHDALLLKNHGVVTVGSDVEEAYFRMETVEHFARILHHAKQLGEVGRLDRSELQRLKDVRDNLRRVRT